MIHSFIYSDGKLVGRDLEVEALRLVRGDKGLVLWVDLDNPTDDEIKAVLEGVFQFHPLAIEDCVAPSDLPKIEDYEDYLFMVMHAVDFTHTDKFASTELDLFMGKDYLVTFHRQPLRSIQTVFERLSKGTGVGPRGPDRIVHSVLDLMVHNFVPVTEALRKELEDIEEIVLAKSSSSEKLVTEILHVRGDFTKLRQIVRPQRDVIDRLARGDSKMVRPTLLPYYRDLRDHLARLEETVTGYHERLMMAFDIYLNKAAFEANEGIKFLTALTAITLPAVLVGGWYGMNFDHMPELRSPHGYLYAWIITIVSTALMAIYLRKKKWF
ncbi:MAG TPA: magnesium/cobalt transporter CorA [Burkholderiaceae bacterium]|nr:magnesium/cobalt transporter CorA [Burkholderiaceae bacterium]